MPGYVYQLNQEWFHYESEIAHTESRLMRACLKATAAQLEYAHIRQVVGKQLEEPRMESAMDTMHLADHVLRVTPKYQVRETKRTQGSKIILQISSRK